MDPREEVIAALEAVARAVFPHVTALVEARSASDWLAADALTGIDLAGGPDFDSCTKLLAESPVVAPIFQGNSYLHHANLAGTPLQPRGIVESLIGYSAACAFWSPSGLTEDAFLLEVRNVANEFLEWCVDQTHQFMVIQAIGLYNVYIDPSLAIPTPFGTLLAAPHGPAMPEVRQLGPMTISFAVDEWADAPSAILLRAKRAGVRRVGEIGDQSDPRVFGTFPSDAATNAALAIVLGAGHHSHSAPTFAGERTAHPLLPTLGTSSRPRTRRRDPGIPVPRSVADEIVNYSEQIAGAQQDGSLMFAGRRLLSALNADRGDDALVDSVVVWEAVFGGTPETGLRVTASVARTLGPQFTDDVPLVEFRRGLATIYAARSNLVHGNARDVAKMIKKNELGNHVANARRYSIRLMRAAMRWPEDIKAMSSSDRSYLAILDPDWPPREAGELQPPSDSTQDAANSPPTEP